MKLCFMFINRDDTKKVENFLSNQFEVKRDSYLGYDTLYVPVDDYPSAITEGIKFINSNDIRTAWWIDEDGQRITVDSIPLLFAEIPPTFKNNKFLKKVSDMLCCKYAKNFQKRLGQTVLIHYTPCENVEFRLARCNEASKNHEYYTKEIIKYCLTHRYIFSYIAVCNAYGKIITIINQNHSVEWPTKTPH